MWLVEDWGTDKFREMVGQQMGGVTLRKGVEEKVLPLLFRPSAVFVHPSISLQAADGVSTLPLFAGGSSMLSLVTDGLAMQAIMLVNMLLVAHRELLLTCAGMRARSTTTWGSGSACFGSGTTVADMCGHARAV
jgi:hypothetical protein